MKTKILLSLFTLIAFGATAQANRAEFTAISEIAPVGNGGTELGGYDTSLSKAELVAQGLAELKADYWEGCGPWRTIKDRRAVINEIAAIEEMIGEGDVASKLTALYNKNEIVAMVGAISSRKVECSLSWFIVYGKDGSKLTMHLNLGD